MSPDVSSTVMRWGAPDLIWALAIPLVAIALFAYGHLVRRHLLTKVGHLALVRRLVETCSPDRRLFRHLLMVLALLLLAGALMRPQYGRRPEALRKTGIDVAFAFDISKSMLARDVQPSRLTAARNQLSRLMTLLKGDRVALVPFAGVAFTQSPLTADQGAIRLYLDSLDPQQMPVGGTNLSMAIREGVRLLSGEEDRGEQKGRSRVLILITDGEDAGSDEGEAVKEAAREAGEKGIQLYAVAVGTRLGEPIPVLNEDGTHKGYQKDSRGKAIYSRLNVALLEELTRAASPSDPEAQRVFQFDGTQPVAELLATSLERLQKAALETAIRQEYGEKYQYLLAPAILLLLLQISIGERKRRRETS